MHCGLCQIKVKNWKVHTEGLLHRKNLERAAKGEFGLSSGMVASGIQAKEAMDKMDSAFNEMRRNLSGEETAEIARKAEERGTKRKKGNPLSRP